MLMLRRLRWGWLLTPLVFTLLTLIATWPMMTRLTVSLNSWGDPQLQTWILAWNAHAMHTAPTTIWQAPIFAPYPDTLAYSDHHLVLSLLASPIIWLTGNAVLAYNLMVLLSFVLTGWALHDLTWEMTGNRTAAWVAGIIFAFCPFRMAQIFHLQLLQTAWLPWSVLFLRRVLGYPRRNQPDQMASLRWRDAAFAGVFLGLQCVTALYYAFFAAAVVSAISGWWAVGQVWRRWRNGTILPWRTVGRLIVVGVVAALIVVPLTLPYLRVYRTLGIVRSTSELDNWSAPVQSYFTVNEENLLAHVGPFAASSGEWVLFPGLVALILGLLALVWRPRSETLIWGAIAGGAFILSLGTGLRWERGGTPAPIPLPYQLLYAHVPGFGALRVPARWGMLVALACAVLAAHAVATILSRLPRGGRQIASGAVLLLVLLESLAIPVRTTNPAALATVAPVYSWLGAPAQADIRRVLELPTGPTPRGDELERITWRMFNSRYHWKELPVAFSGLIPFGTTDLLAAIQHLPAPAALEYAQLVGIDTLVLHRDEFAAADLTALEAGLARSPLVRQRADLGTARVYTLLPNPQLLAFEQTSGAVFVSNDQRVPGMVALALTQRWQAAGRTVVGGGRLKYYAPLQSPEPGAVWALGVLAAAEDPRSYGFSTAGRVWSSNGLAFYRASASLLANVDLAQRDPNRTHPTYPTQLVVALTANGGRVGAADVAWTTPITSAVLELDVASLRDDTLTVGDTPIPITAGATTVRVPLKVDDSSTIATDAAVLVRARVWRVAPLDSLPPAGLVVQASSAWNNSLVRVDAAQGGAGGLVLNVWGAAARDDRPVHSVVNAQPTSSNGAFRWELDVLNPTQTATSPIDGRYIVYLNDAARPAAPGLPVATFTIANGSLRDTVAVPLPLTVLP